MIVLKTNIKALKERLVSCKSAMSLNYGNLAILFHDSAMHYETILLIDKM